MAEIEAVFGSPRELHNMEFEKINDCGTSSFTSAAGSPVTQTAYDAFFFESFSKVFGTHAIKNIRQSIATSKLGSFGVVNS